MSRDGILEIIETMLAVEEALLEKIDHRTRRDEFVGCVASIETLKDLRKTILHGGTA